MVCGRAWRPDAESVMILNNTTYGTRMRFEILFSIIFTAKGL